MYFDDVVWDRGSFFYYSYKTTIADKNLTELTQAELFTDEVMF